MRNPIIAALDVPSAEAARELAGNIGPAVGAFKIGSELFTSAGPEIVKTIRSGGSGVFLDLKFHDIPNTVAKAVAAAVRLDVQMLTVHAGGGPGMLRAAETAAQETARALGKVPPLVLAVTVLTSMDSNALCSVGVPENVGKQVERLARMAVEAGVRGLVCSPLELPLLRTFLPSEIQLVTPGIRTGAEAADDQKRTLTPQEAVKAGADWLVIGRPIYGAKNPRAAAEGILESISSAASAKRACKSSGFGAS
jgi:orotidine-5'-phosphate decarboxylase